MEAFDCLSVLTPLMVIVLVQVRKYDQQIAAVGLWCLVCLGFAAYATFVFVGQVELRDAPPQSVTFHQGAHIPELQVFPNVVSSILALQQAWNKERI